MPDKTPETLSEKTLIIVDDEPGIRQLVSIFLRRYRFNILEADSGKALFEILQKNNPVDLILLDLMLPDIYGIDICKEIRKTSQVPIIMLTAAQGEMNMVLGFEAGADDYIEKPFSVHVLLSRIQALLRRSQGLNPTPSQSEIPITDSFSPSEEPLPKTSFKKAVFDTWSYLPDQASLHSTSGRSVVLTRTECLLLNKLLIQNNQIIDRKILISELNLPIDDLESRAIDVQISRLRHKLRDRPDANLIQSVRNKGYALISPVRFES